VEEKDRSWIPRSLLRGGFIITEKADKLTHQLVNENFLFDNITK